MCFTASAPVTPNSCVKLGCALSCDHLNIINLGSLLFSLDTLMLTILGDWMWVVWHLQCDTGYEAADTKHPSWNFHNNLSSSHLLPPSLKSASRMSSEEEMGICHCSVRFGSGCMCGPDWVMFSLLAYCLLTGGFVTLWGCHCWGDETWLDVVLRV